MLACGNDGCQARWHPNECRRDCQATDEFGMDFGVQLVDGICPMCKHPASDQGICPLCNCEGALLSLSDVFKPARERPEISTELELIYATFGSLGRDESGGVSWVERRAFWKEHGVSSQEERRLWSLFWSAAAAGQSQGQSALMAHNRQQAKVGNS